MKKLIFIAFSLISITGCATRPAVTISAPFDEQATVAQLRDGSNTIKGSALFRQMGGGVVTCAGFPVQAIPATAYAKARIVAIYGSVEGGMAPVYQANPIFNPDPPAYKTHTKQTRCDAQGFFKFEKLADGEYYVQSVIAWQINYAMQGGSIMTLVSLKDGETKEVVLAR